MLSYVFFMSLLFLFVCVFSHFRMIRCSFLLCVFFSHFCMTVKWVVVFLLGPSLGQRPHLRNVPPLDPNFLSVGFLSVGPGCSLIGRNTCGRYSIASHAYRAQCAPVYAASFWGACLGSG